MVKQTAEQKADLKAAEKAAPDEETLRRIAASVPPLQRDADHSFVPVEKTDREEDPELVQPNLTGTSMAAVEADYVADEGSKLKLTRHDYGGKDRTGSTYERSSAIDETDLERMTDEQLKDSGALSKATPRIHPARIAPSSDRPRQPGSTAPAAGAGSWPVHEGQMPAVMPTDPVVEKADEKDGDATFAKAAGFKQTEDGTLARKGLRISKKDTTHAAALYLRLRQQFPNFTKEQLADEFEVQWLSGRAGAPQSHRPGEELSQHGLTAVGDDRVDVVKLGELRATEAAAFEADPEKPAAGPSTPEAGLPSENEPASTAVDAAKESSGETAKADEKAVAQTEKIAEKESKTK